MSNDKYILDDNGEPIFCDDLMEWGMWFQLGPASRRVAKDVINGTTVSTVFLGLDHSYGDGPPVLWETMTFNGEWEGEQDRCSGNRQDAIAMHQRMVQKVSNPKHTL